MTKQTEKATENKVLTVSKETKAGAKITALGTKFNNFNVINNKDKAAPKPHLAKLNEVQRAGYNKYFDSVEKAAKVKFNREPGSYVNCIIPTEKARINVQFYCSANKYMLCLHVNKKHVKTLLTHTLIVAKDAKIMWDNYVTIYGLTIQNVREASEIIAHAAKF